MTTPESVPMSPEENKEIARRIFNIANNADLSSLNEVVAEDFVYRATNGDEYQGVDGLKDLIGEFHNAFPNNLEFSIEQMYAEGNKVTTIYRQMGTQTGELRGIAPANGEMNILVCAVGTFDSGKLVNQYEIFDTLELLKQLGAVAEDIEFVGEQRAGR